VTGTKEVLDFWAASLQGFFGGVGFLVVMLLMAGIRERIEMLPVPEAMRGMAMGFICTALMALSFAGFTGLTG
jgi:electron transport complex protein RnfA